MAENIKHGRCDQNQLSTAFGKMPLANQKG